MKMRVLYSLSNLLFFFPLHKWAQPIWISSPIQSNIVVQCPHIESSMAEQRPFIANEVVFLFILSCWDKRKRNALGVLRLQNLRRAWGIECGEFRRNTARNETQSRVIPQHSLKVNLLAVHSCKTLFVLTLESQERLLTSLTCSQLFKTLIKKKLQCQGELWCFKCLLIGGFSTAQDKKAHSFSRILWDEPVLSSASWKSWVL